MANPIQSAVVHLGCIAVDAGEPYTTADILTAYPSGEIIIMKTRSDRTSPVKVGIDGTLSFEIEFNEFSAIETGHTYVFNKKCDIVIAKFGVTSAGA